MDPVTALVAASTAVSTVGAISSGNQQASSYNQQANAADANAKIATQQAGSAYAAGVANETQQRRQAGQQLGEQRAAVGASGFDPNSGSALQTQQDSAFNGEMDALQTRYQGLLTGYGYDTQSQQDRYQAKVLRSSASNARTSGYLSAATGLLTGAAGYAKLAGAAGAGSGITQGGGLGLRIRPTGFWS